MIRVRHDVDVLQLLKNRGYNTGVIRKRRLLGQSTLTTLRHKGRLSMGELEAVCGLLGGQPGDYIEYVPDTVGVGDVGSGEAEARAAGDGAGAEAVTVEPAEAEAQAEVDEDLIELYAAVWSICINRKDRDTRAYYYLHDNHDYARAVLPDFTAANREPIKIRDKAVAAFVDRIIAHIEAEGRAETGSADGAGDLSPGDGGTV